MGSDKIIEAIELHKSFGSNKVLDGASLCIDKGESMVILGGSGTGKSVFIKHLIRLLDPDSGKIFVDGEDISKISRKKMSDFRKQFGMLFQGSALFDSLTVGENVGFGLREHTDLPRRDIDKVVKEKLAMVGLYDVENLKPAELSGGMKKRAGLARAIAMNPSIILYDEPTTGLDPLRADQINELISDINNKTGSTSVTITHDMVSANRLADRVAFLYKGKFVSVGSPETVFNSDQDEVKDFCRLGKLLRDSNVV